MARLASEAKGGYYATPPEELALVLKRIAVGKGSAVNIADFCCGAGAALKQVADHFSAQGAKVTTYGVENEQGRARAAAQVLDKVVYDNFEDLVMTNKAVSFTWLNPPYGINRRDGHSERSEVAFLRSVTRSGGYLARGALVGFCIPKEVLYHTAQVLSYRMTGFSIYRFTDKNYGRFKQVVLLGYLKGAVNFHQRQEVEKWLKYVGFQCDYRAIPPLDRADDILYRVLPSTKEVSIFHGKHIDPEQAAREVEQSTNWSTVENFMLPPAARNKQNLPRPLLPLKTGQIALAIAAGAIDGHMGSFIFKGGSKKVVHETTEFTETGQKKIFTEHLLTFTRVFIPGRGVRTLE